MKKYSTSPALREMQIKTTMRYHLTAVRMATNKTRNIKFGRGYGEEEPSGCWGERKLVQPLLKTVRRLLKKLRIGLPHDPAIPLLGISSKNLKTFLPKDICIPMLIVSLLMVANHKCPLIDVCIKKMWDVCVCIYTHTHTQWNIIQP